MTIALIVLAVLVVIAIVMYNSLVGKKNAVENAFGSIDVMCKKRYDLIPNLVATVKQYAAHEAGTLEKVTALRNQAAAGNLSPDETVQLNNQLSHALSGLMVQVEAYPELKANENFMQLQRALNEIEEQLSASRRAYNASVTDFNNAVEMFPTNIMAGMMRYTRRQLFEAVEAERKNVDVGSLFNG
jgi:LemA protein